MCKHDSCSSHRLAIKTRLKSKANLGSAPVVRDKDADVSNEAFGCGLGNGKLYPLSRGEQGRGVHPGKER